ncbi:VMAP-C domain-containing protein [Phytohabitans kaempferiae]|uniref:Helicase XPB/Ssl2 N-terminal domain-containing protein n=1 Tax=Phytohabitans kaempferiae TaxID=1620943 RepID=A0ABV6MEZ8_9ACTN
MPTWAGIEVVESLVAALEDIAETKDAATRDQIVELVGLGLRVDDPDARLDPKRPTSQRAHLVEIVTAVLNRPRTLRLLAQAVAVVAPGQPATQTFTEVCEELARREPVWMPDADRLSLLDELAGLTLNRAVSALLADATSPTRGYPAVGTLRAAVTWLEGRHSSMPLFRFLEFAAASATELDAADGLRRWIDEHLRLVPEGRRAELVALRERLRRQLAPAEGGKPCLEIRLEPVDEHRFSVAAWLSEAGEAAPNCGPEETVTREELQSWLRGLLERYATTTLAPERRARIEFVLPRSHLNEPVDRWELTRDGNLRRLGALYRVSVRPDGRSPEGSERLARRRKITARVIATGHAATEVAEWLASTTGGDAREETDRLEQADWAWLAITCPMVALAAEAVEAVVDTGAPVAVWVRGERGSDARRKVLTDVSSARPVDELPDAVWRFRELGWAGQDDIRRDLVLLWDDPTRTPPDDLTLVAPRPAGVFK